MLAVGLLLENCRQKKTFQYTPLFVVLWIHKNNRTHRPFHWINLQGVLTDFRSDDPLVLRKIFQGVLIDFRVMALWFRENYFKGY